MSCGSFTQAPSLCTCHGEDVRAAIVTDPVWIANTSHLPLYDHVKNNTYQPSLRFLPLPPPTSSPLPSHFSLLLSLNVHRLHSGRNSR